MSEDTPANAPVSPEAEFAVAFEGLALIMSFLSPTTIKVALEAERAKPVFLVQGRSGRALGDRLLTFDEIQAAYMATPPVAAPLLGLSPGEDAKGRGAQLFNAIWPLVLDAADDGLSPGQCLAPLAASVARIIAAQPPGEHTQYFKVYCTNLRNMITAEFQVQQTRARAPRH